MLEYAKLIRLRGVLLSTDWDDTSHLGVHYLRASFDRTTACDTKESTRDQRCLEPPKFTLITPDPPVNAATNKAIAAVAVVLP